MGRCMKRVVVVLGVVTLMALTGCVKEDPDFGSPVSRIPKIILDYVNDTTKIYIYAVDDYRYTSVNITVTAGNTTQSTEEHYTYTAHLYTHMRNFTLVATAATAKGVYSLRAEVRHLFQEDTFMEIDVHREKSIKTVRLTEDDLPWKSLIERVS